MVMNYEKVQYGMHVKNLPVGTCLWLGVPSGTVIIFSKDPVKT